MTGGSAAMPPLLRSLAYFLYAFAAAVSSVCGDAVDVPRVLQEVLEDLPLALAGRAAERRRLEVGHVEPERSSPCASAVAVVRVSASGYALGDTLLFGDEKPPRFAQIVAASRRREVLDERADRRACP